MGVNHSVKPTAQHQKWLVISKKCSEIDRCPDIISTSGGCDQLVGLVPVIEDWHTKVILLKVKYCTMSISLLMSLLGDLEDPLQNLIWFK